MSAEQLFERFLPLYPPEARADLARARTTDANPAGNRHILGQLDDIADTFAKLAPGALAAPVLSLDRSDASVHRLGAALTRDVRDRLLESDLVEVVTHGAVYVGACVVANHDARWEVRNPLWESRVRLSSRAGIASLSVFQWWLKSLSDDEIDAPRLADRYFLNVELPCARPESLPIIATRVLPRLGKVRYDTLHRHLRAHLPELRDVGEHFPSPERFAELGFRWLEALLVGGGRMLVLHGPTDSGVHLFWLDIGGFVCAAFYPSEEGDHRLETDGDKLCLTMGDQRHEMLWWGPTS